MALNGWNSGSSSSASSAWGAACRTSRCCWRTARGRSRWTAGSRLPWSRSTFRTTGSWRRAFRSHGTARSGSARDRTPATTVTRVRDLSTAVATHAAPRHDAIVVDNVHRMESDVFRKLPPGGGWKRERRGAAAGPAVARSAALPVELATQSDVPRAAGRRRVGSARDLARRLLNWPRGHFLAEPAMRCAKRRHRNKRVARKTASTDRVSAQPEYPSLGLTGDAMVNAMDRAAPSLKALYKAV